MKTQKQISPQVGQVFTHPSLGNVKIVAVLPMGTIEVKNIYTNRYYRISGLPLLNP